jgi:hypothetical protein
VEGNSKLPFLLLCLLFLFSFLDSISSTDALTTIDDDLDTFGLKVSFVLLSDETYNNYYVINLASA